jgi:SHS2 domain-containing protein
MKSYETFSTTADVGIRVRGRDCRELYRRAIEGLNELLFGPGGVDPAAAKSHRFEYRGDACENVLVNLLAEVAFRVYEKRRMVCGLRIMEADDFHLKAEFREIPWPRMPQLEIKSVTYHRLKIRETKEGKEAEIIMDV